MNEIYEIYEGQSAIQLRVVLGIDITGNKGVIIKVQPDKSSLISWTAVVDNVLTGEIHYNFTTSLPIDSYTFWVETTEADDRVAISDPMYFTVYKKGKLSIT